MMKEHLYIFLLLFLTKLVSSAPKTWPYMKSHDIWGGDTNNNTIDTVKNRSNSNSFRNFMNIEDDKIVSSRKRKAKVLNFFPSFSVDDECLSDDGRRVGMCMNVYECRIQGGTSRGDCALGFGACCVFETTCNEEVHNNITYFVSPKFPALMPSDKDHCSIKIKLVSDEINQIRLDFVHFSLGQPNRSTGACENDIFSLEGGIIPFILCGQNSGQHIFYDVGSSKARAQQELKINVNFNKRSVATRLWEIKISQIPFSARAPSGCLQYFTGAEGVIQTFNFADNGRHLANQNYRSCIRQETGRCSVQYEPCDDNSFRIGPMSVSRPGMLGGSGIGSMPASDAALADETMLQDEMNQLDENGDPINPADSDMVGAEGEMPAGENDELLAEETDDQQADETQNDEETQDDEGSGGDTGGFFGGFPTFSFPTFFRSFSSNFEGRDLGRDNFRQGRQISSPCVDRITLPCIVEDFIGAGMGDIPSCIPIHCGNSFSKLETAVTPFYLGVHFGDGKKNKGSAEDNIGACLRYKQLACS